MNKESKIFVAGHRGLVGSALMRHLKQLGYINLVTRTHALLDLTDQVAVADFFAEEKPDYVFLAAAKVGGIYANNTYPAEFVYQNLAIQTNVIHQSYLHNVKRLLFLGSSCIYPKDCPQPIKEEYLLTGPLETTNRPYALAKIAGIEMCWSYNRQYGTQFLAVMPTNLYGPGDSYDLENSHVIPALIQKFHNAKINNFQEVIVWGTGKPKREFLYSDDMASACVFLLELSEKNYLSILGADSDYSQVPLVNVGSGIDQTIADLACIVKSAVGYEGEIAFDLNKPDGTLRKLISSNKLNGLGWKNNVQLADGLVLAYQDFCERNI